MIEERSYACNYHCSVQHWISLQTQVETKLQRTSGDTPFVVGVKRALEMTGRCDRTNGQGCTLQAWRLIKACITRSVRKGRKGDCIAAASILVYYSQ